MLRSIATQHATSYEAVVLCHAQGSREVTLSSGEGALSDVTIHRGREGVKGGKKRCKQRLQGAMATTDHDDGNDGEAGGSGVRHVLSAGHSDKHQARPPTDHFKRLLEEACPNHAYSIQHKLKDYDMMRSFMTSGSLTWGAELDEGLNGSDTTPFPEEKCHHDGLRRTPPYWGGAACLT
jgi:hypothetical protein